MYCYTRILISEFFFGDNVCLVVLIVCSDCKSTAPAAGTSDRVPARSQILALRKQRLSPAQRLSALITAGDKRKIFAPDGRTAEILKFLLQKQKNPV